MNVATKGAAQPTAKFAEAKIEHPDRVPSDAAPDPINAPPASSESVKPSPTVDPSTPLVPRYKLIDQPVTRTGQVAVFVSRQENKVFVRQGFVHMFELPVAIDDPDQALGTHGHPYGNHPSQNLRHGPRAQSGRDYTRRREDAL